MQILSDHLTTEDRWEEEHYTHESCARIRTCCMYVGCGSVKYGGVTHPTVQSYYMWRFIYLSLILGTPSARTSHLQVLLPCCPKPAKKRTIKTPSHAPHHQQMAPEHRLTCPTEYLRPAGGAATISWLLPSQIQLKDPCWPHPAAPPHLQQMSLL